MTAVEWLQVTLLVLLIVLVFRWVVFDIALRGRTERRDERSEARAERDELTEDEIKRRLP